MAILDKIVADKKREVAESKERYPRKHLEQSAFFERAPLSLRACLERADQSGVIAEIKRKSPSRGMLNEHISLEELAPGYVKAGASALSILTDHDYFGGSNSDLTAARKLNHCPILRKEFIIDEYQIIEAKAIGADAVLLIARILPPAQIRVFAALAAALGLEVLLEIHDRLELERSYCAGIALIGVNNRDLDTLTTDVGLSRRLVEFLPDEACKVAESGISDAATVDELYGLGYRGFLIGETFMREAQPERACRRLIEELFKLRAGMANAQG